MTRLDAPRLPGVLGSFPPAVLAFLGRCTFPPPAAPLTCAVSGGPDSLALLALASAAGCAVRAIHVDHGLREGSCHEGAVVADAARRLGAAFEQIRVEVPAGPNLEARARAARFGCLPADVATGHTMDDQAETVLANLLRGSGLDGLSGMRPGTRHPLLGLRRAEARSVCRALGLRWISDPTNDDPRYLRNRVRHELIPVLSSVSGRDPVPVLARQAALLSDEARLLDDLAGLAVPDPSDARTLSDAPDALARRAVRGWLRANGVTAQSGGRDPDHDRHPPSSAEVARVLGVADGDAAGTELSGGWQVRRRNGRLRVVPPVPSKVTPVQQPVQQDEAPAPPRWAAAEVGPVVVTAEELNRKVRELGARITADYADAPPLLIGVLKGAMVFMSDLCRAIDLPVDIDFMAVASYGSSTRTSGVVRIVKDLDAELTDRRVLVVEDIIDSGLTLNYLSKYLRARRPAALDVCALLVKEGNQRIDLDLRYVGFRIPSEFVVGYGLDVDERYRNLSDVRVYRGDDRVER